MGVVQHFALEGARDKQTGPFRARKELTDMPTEAQLPQRVLFRLMFILSRCGMVHRIYYGHMGCSLAE